MRSDIEKGEVLGLLKSVTEKDGSLDTALYAMASLGLMFLLGSLPLKKSVKSFTIRAIRADTNKNDIVDVALVDIGEPSQQARQCYGTSHHTTPASTLPSPYSPDLLFTYIAIRRAISDTKTSSMRIVSVSLMS
jgi:hypothetical protein